jgi:hypothetical protein
MVRAVESLKNEWAKEAIDNLKTRISEPSKPIVRVVTGEEAQAIADKPHLTGNPEWDRIELEETNPDKEPLDLSRFL